MDTKLPPLDDASTKRINQLIGPVPVKWRKRHQVPPAIFGRTRNEELVTIKLLVDGWRYAIVDLAGWKMLTELGLTNLPWYFNQDGTRQHAYVRVRPLAADAQYDGRKEAPLTIARILTGVADRTAVKYRDRRPLNLIGRNLYLANSEDAKRDDKDIAEEAAQGLEEQHQNEEMIGRGLSSGWHDSMTPALASTDGISSDK